MSGTGEMIEALLNEPYRVIDILPERVPEKAAGRYFAAEKYWLQPPMLADLRRRFDAELDRTLSQIAAEVKALAERYDRPLASLEADVAALREKVMSHLAEMGVGTNVAAKGAKQ